MRRNFAETLLVGGEPTATTLCRNGRKTTTGYRDEEWRGALWSTVHMVRYFAHTPGAHTRRPTSSYVHYKLARHSTGLLASTLPV